MLDALFQFVGTVKVKWSLKALISCRIITVILYRVTLISFSLQVS